MNKKILGKESEKRIAEIEAEMHLARERSLADANKYKTETEAESNKAKLTPEFLQWSMYQSLAQNTKVYFGNSIPKIFSTGDGIFAAEIKSTDHHSTKRGQSEN